jgi:argininosuccinate lyase
MTVWAARTGVALDPRVDEFLRAEDAELLPYDCAATALHAQRLHVAGILNDDELTEIETRLATIADEGAAFLGEYEDVHSAIEGLLGTVGRKIHAGRSRNDQVAAAARLYVEDASREADTAIGGFIEAILEVAEREATTPMPGYTHLQRAQPITVGHHLHAWIEMLERDRTRFAAAAAASEPSPLGAGALAGSTLPLPLPANAMRNSIDAVSDRDFVLDYVYAAAVLFTHLSRIGEDLVLWSSSEFGFALLPGNAATGSSIMPQKLNPDVAELARGKAGSQIGRLTGLLAVVKGLPLAYDRDLQEDKTPLFATRRDVRLALGALDALVSGLELDRERLAAAVGDPLLLATDAAEALVRDGLPFRDAHEQVASAVREGTFMPPKRAALRPAPGPSGIVGALHDARLRLDARSLASLQRTLVGRDLTTLTTWNSFELASVLDLAEQLKSAQKNGIEHRLLPGRTLGLLFTRPSTRTRVSFAAAMEQLGGSAIALNTGELQLSRGEPLEDTARVLSGYLDALAVRWPSQADLETLARHASIPVINALTDDEHPCQALADALTIRERCGDLRNVRVAYIGDGNNVCASLMIACSALGAEVVCATPPGYEPGPGALSAACSFGGKVHLTQDPYEAVRRSTPMCGRAWATRTSVRSAAASSRASRSTRRCSLPPRRAPSSSTACPHTSARRSRAASSTGRSRRSGSRPRTGCTCRRRCSR